MTVSYITSVVCCRQSHLITSTRAFIAVYLSSFKAGVHLSLPWNSSPSEPHVATLNIFAFIQDLKLHKQDSWRCVCLCLHWWMLRFDPLFQQGAEFHWNTNGQVINSCVNIFWGIQNGSLWKNVSVAALMPQLKESQIWWVKSPAAQIWCTRKPERCMETHLFAVLIRACGAKLDP